MIIYNLLIIILSQEKLSPNSLKRRTPNIVDTQNNIYKKIQDKCH